MRAPRSPPLPPRPRPVPKPTEPRRVPPSRRRSAFRDGRGRGRGRGRGPGRGSPFDNHDDDDDDDVDEDAVPARRERRDDVFFPPSDDDADARSAPASSSTGADLEALFAECDQAALPRQHPHTYMDPSWAVDDLPELERVLGATASDAGDMSLDPVALAEKLAALPLAELLGLSDEYVEYMHGDAARDERTAKKTKPTSSGEGSNPRPVDAETKDHARRESRADAAANVTPEPADDDLDRLLADEGVRGGIRNAVGAASTIEASANAHVGGDAEDDDLDELLGETRPGGFAATTKTTTTTAADDDAFLDELLGS